MGDRHGKEFSVQEEEDQGSVEGTGSGKESQAGCDNRCPEEEEETEEE